MMKIIDGKSLAQKVLQDLKQDPILLQAAKEQRKIGVIAVAPTVETLSFIRLKAKVAQELGLGCLLRQFPADISQTDLVREIKTLSASDEIMGVIVQLPLPEQLDVQAVFNALPFQKDIDVLSEAGYANFFFGNSSVIPPVTGAIRLICEAEKIELRNKLVVVLGAGKLIGIPTLAWFAKQGAFVCSFNDSRTLLNSLLKQADILVAGLGQPGFLKKEMLKKGAIVFDAGYSLVDGKSVGDVDFASVKEKAALITPVPGGIGPLTVALLFKNALELYKLYQLK